jgi:hypothetical protein
MISAPTQQPDGTLSYRVQSPYQQAETQIHVLIPENEPQGECAGILYVLPVEPASFRPMAGFFFLFSVSF